MVGVYLVEEVCKYGFFYQQSKGGGITEKLPVKIEETKNFWKIVPTAAQSRDYFGALYVSKSSHPTAPTPEMTL